MSGKIINKRRNNYTVIPNEIIKAKDLSWKAKGLMCYLLSLSEEWTVHKSDLVNRSTDGYDSMLSGWNELESLGYIQTIRLKDQNLFKGYDYIIHESRVRDFTEQEIPEQGNPELISNSLKQVPLIVDTNVSIVELSTSTTTGAVLNDKDKCHLFVQAFNSKKVIGGKKSKYQSTTKICSALKNRLKNYTSKELLKVLDLALKDELIKKKYITPEYILRENIIERYLNTQEEDQHTSSKSENYIP